ncbi:MAG: PD40 domain-containing protein [Chloroflexi bacterium]|nr:PD40 domain-containing protein [Chloroflexota bacterium]OJV96608.1 MAG: hypothetical protein BGO39_10155 [Chloroflexi bacterium 54-19]
MSSSKIKGGFLAAWLVVLLLGLQLLVACGDAATSTPTTKDENLPQDRVLVLSNKDGWPDLYTVDLTGKFTGRLTQSAAAEYSPSWSPDGKRVVFTELNGDEAAGDYASNRRIVVMDADGKNRKVVAQDGLNPVWSPDSQRILFTRVTTTTGQANQSGSKAANIAAAPTATPGNGPALTPMQTPDNGSGRFPILDDSTPTPATTAKGSQQSSLYTVTVDNGQPALLVADAVSGSWSPNGKRLVYISGNNVLDMKRSLNIANADGSSPISLSERAKITDLDIIFASWSPDSATLAFTATDTQKDKISLYKISVESGGSRRVADYDGSAHEIMSMIWAYADFYSPASRLHLAPAWSPNGRSIAFSDGSARLQVIDTSTGNIRFYPVGTASLGQDKDSVLGVSWLPDNRRLVYDRANVGRNTLQSQAGNYIYDFFDETLETLDTVNKNTLTLMSGPGSTFQASCCGMDTLGAGSPTATTSSATAQASPTATANPTASKTGKLVYVSGIGQRQLIVNDLATGKQTVITSGTFKQIDFNLAPKGDKMVYVEVGDRFNSTLYVVGLDGKNKQKLSEGSGNPDDLSYLTSWSADGKELAFQSLNGDPRLKTGLYTVEVDDLVKSVSAPRLITTQNASAFAWSPDGSKIAYRVENLTYELYISPADGSQPGKQIASVGNFDTRYSSLGKGLAWSPDGQYLAMSGAAGFASYSSIWDIWLVTPDGKVDDQPGYYINRIIGFTPDNSRLIATVASSNQSSTIQAFVLGNTGSSLRGWRSYDRGSGPLISPDGLNLAYYTQNGDGRFDGSNNAATSDDHRLVVVSFSNGNSRAINLDYMPYYSYKARFYTWEPGNGQSLIYYQNNTIYVTSGQGNPLKSDVLARAFAVDRLGWSKG